MRTFFNPILVAFLAPGVTLMASKVRAADSRVDASRLNRSLTEMAEFGKNPMGGVSRVAYSDADRAGREYAMALMKKAGLEPKTDEAGNLIGTRPGTEAGLAPIGLGSHIDTVPEGGNYDGIVGSLSAIEAIQSLEDQGVRLRHPLRVMIFQNEEGGHIGSRALTSGLLPKDLALISLSGKLVKEGIRFIGGNPDELQKPQMKKGDLAAYLELHIEQGGVLENKKNEIGVVEGIVGIQRWDVTVNGFANHAGTTPMNMRKDALLAASLLIVDINRAIRSIPGKQVGTVGKIVATPNAPNVIAGKAVFSVEFRDLETNKILKLFKMASDSAAKISQTTGTEIKFSQTYSTTPAPTDGRIRKIVADVSHRLHLKTMEMPSGAGHDAQEMATIAPMGMIFIPSVQGVSHSPKEFTPPRDIENGANVLLQSLIQIDQKL